MLDTTGLRLMLAALVVLLAAAPLLAAPPVVERLSDLDLDELLSVENGTVEAVQQDGRTVWRWSIPAGQTSHLAIRRDHPLFDRLRYYDRLQFDYRIAGGEISSISLNALGHVSGPRLYKVHNFSIARITTEPGVWHPHELDLAQPYWFPWDEPDGGGEEGFFRFECLAISPGTVVELRDVRLVRGLLYLKPDFQLPITWPVKTEHEDGSVSYALKYHALNTSGQPARINAQVISEHSRFQVALDKANEEVKSGKVAEFALTATLSAADIEATEELYAEPLRVAFTLEHHPEVSTVWSGTLVRPLSKGYRRQVIVPESDVAQVRQILQAGGEDAARFKGMIGYDATVAAADDFLTKELLAIPHSHAHVRNGYPNPWRPGDRMPEAVNPQTGERQFGTTLAGQVWMEHLAFAGQATEKTGLAYLLTGDEKYAQKAIELMRLYAQQYAQQSWACLFDVPYYQGSPIQTSSRVASNSSYGTNWQFKWHCKMLSLIADSPSWTPEIRQEVYQGFVLPFATELAKLPGSISNQTDISNHDLLLLGLVFDDAHLVYQATMTGAGLVMRLKDIDADGFSSEGRPLNYHFAAMSEYLPSVTHLENSGLAVDYGKERILAALRMPYYRATLTGDVPNTGDSGRGQRVGPQALADVLLPLAPDARWLAEIGTGSTLTAKLQRFKTANGGAGGDWQTLLSTEPHLFREAGLAILRSGRTPQEQIMLTLDYGRNVFHGGYDRNQITLNAFGKVFTHGTGSLYNAGSGGIEYNRDPKLSSFGSYNSVSLNVITADQQNQLRAAGSLKAWSEDPAYQVAVAEVPGIYPGVSHTRGVVLTEGLVILLDRVEGDREHSYDFIYHNFGELKLGEGWQAQPLDPGNSPLGATANYDNVVDPRRLTGQGVLRLTWDLTRQYPAWRDKDVDPATLPAVFLDLWQLPVQGGEVFTGQTGLNNTNTAIMSDAAPSLFHRVQAEDAAFYTVLEPHKGQPRVAKVAPADGGIEVTLKDGRTLRFSLDALIREHAIR